MRNNKAWRRWDDFIYWVNGHNQLYSWWRDICNYCNSVYRYHRAVTTQVDWDYEGMFDLLLVKVEGLADSLECGGGHSCYGSKRSACKAKADPDFFKCKTPPVEAWEVEQEQWGVENAKAQVKNGIACRVCVRLLRRLSNPDFYTDLVYGKDGELGYTKERFDMEDRMVDRDQALLFKLMDRYLRSWWT